MSGTDLVYAARLVRYSFAMSGTDLANSACGTELAYAATRGPCIARAVSYTHLRAHETEADL
eukprot:2495510-Rhodomonas_salina.3